MLVKIRQYKQAINKAIYLVLGVNVEGHKVLIGMQLLENEDPKFWLGIMNRNKKS
jgi:putative transposase|tara:strand:+ start:70 stop:234 length:165 start_codon:yes stop_codon:yes gene_type:complete